MKYHQELPCFAVVFSLFFINAAYSETQSAKSDDDDSKTIYITKQKFTLKCNGTGADTVIWDRDGNNLTADGKYIKMTRDKDTKEFVLSREGAKDVDAGNYTCTTLTKDGKKINIQSRTVAFKVFVKVDHDNVNVAEGERLKIICQSFGSPKIRWLYKNETFNETYHESQDRVILSPGGESNIVNSVFEINETQLYDRGEYICIGQSPIDGKEVSSKCTVRVKDRYAALWPFLGICAEVFVLCLIIFIYEKKRNKTELEESDTDQSPDQKNTPDHGKESNLRHRQ